MEGIYERLKESADAMDCDAIDAALKEADGYVIPEGETDKLYELKKMADQFDYEGILDILSEKQ